MRGNPRPAAETNEPATSRWAVILAGGEGQRLHSLTRFLSGDDRPKQFCALLGGGRSLLAFTRARVATSIAPKHTVFVVNRKHSPFYARELQDVPHDRIVEQPSNRGTLVAMLASLVRIARDGRDPVVGFFPSDHYFSHAGAFADSVVTAFSAAEARPSQVVLFGARALSPETGYGYIEPARRLAGHAGKLRKVIRFWEMPSLSVARRLVRRGCLWNTFVMVGRASTFLRMIQQAAPRLYATFEPWGADAVADSSDLDEIYHNIPDADFSKLVLSANADQTAVLDLGDIGWSDLGDPDRLIATLSQHGIPNPWRELWLREMGISRVTSRPVR